MGTLKEQKLSRRNIPELTTIKKNRNTDGRIETITYQRMNSTCTWSEGKREIF